MYKSKLKKGSPGRRRIRPTVRGSSPQRKLCLAVIRGFLAGAGTVTLMLCALSVAFANTNLPLSWIGPAACVAAACGSFVSGLVLSHGVERFRLLSGLACGVFYCLCAIGAGLLSARMPTADGRNLSLMAVLMLGAVAGSAAGALRKGGSHTERAR